MALNAGINMMPSKLIVAEGKYHFITERYDRRNGKKIHTQTLAAMSPDATSYENGHSMTILGKSSGIRIEQYLSQLVPETFAKTMQH